LGAYASDFRDFKYFRLDFKDLKFSNGFRPDFKEFKSGVRDFSDLKLGFMDFWTHFRYSRSDLKGFRPCSRDFTSDFKVFRDFTSVFKVFKPDFIVSIGFHGLNRDFRSDFRTIVHRISEVVGPSMGTVCSINLYAKTNRGNFIALFFCSLRVGAVCLKRQYNDLFN